MTILRRLRQPLRSGLQLVRTAREVRARALGALGRLVDRVAGGESLAIRLAAAARATPAGVLDDLVRGQIASHGTAAVAEHARRAIEQLGASRARRTLFAAALAALASADRAAALAFGDSLVDLVADRKCALQLAALHAEGGAIERPLELMLRFPGGDKQDRVDHLRQRSALLRAGYRMPPAAPRAWQPAHDRRVLYYLSQCLPHHSSGYGIRTHWLLRHLAARGWDMAAVARFGYPNDRYDFRDRATADATALIDDIRYHFRPDALGFRDGEEAYIARAARELVEQAGEIRPALIHAASNYQVGLAAIAAARTLGLPSIYEVRGLWHMTRTSKDPPYGNSDHYRMSEELEVQAAREADHVLVITRAILDRLAGRGVDRAKMTLLPNAVDTDEFTPRARDERLAAELGLAGKVVIGMIGTFKRYEGIDLLLQAVARMRGQLGDPIGVLLVGDGPEADSLAAMARRLGIADLVAMPGRVPPARVADYYSVMDICSYPRTAAEVCQFVSPLKPLEAMAMEKAVVLSDVRAQAEMVEHRVTGLVHPAEDLDALVAALSTLVTTPALRAELGARARESVVSHRSWVEITRPVDELYRALVSRSA